MALEKGKSRMIAGNRICEVRCGHGVIRGGEEAGLTGEDSSHGEEEMA